MLIIRSREELEHQIVTLHAEGVPIRALTRRFAMGRNTIRRILRKNRVRRDQGHDALKKKTPVLRNSKLDPYFPLIKDLVERYPRITGVRVHEELTAAGFDGGSTIVTDYLRKVRPKPKKDPVVRFETGPGKQGQMDWSPYTICFTRTGKTQVLCFSYILGFSRRQYIDFTHDRKFFTLIRRHQDAFSYFEGVPRTCLYDNEKTVVLRWEAGMPIYNPSFIAFITHYHCRPIACLPGRPETKGKIEAPFQYIEKNLLNGRKFRDMEDLRETAKWWLLNRSDPHPHDTTGRPPLELFMEQEQSALMALPIHPYDTAQVALRVCRVDGFLEHDTNLYSVPFEYVADILTLKATEREIFVYGPDLSLIAHHERKPVGAGATVEDPEHRKSSKIRYGLEPVKEAFLALGGGADGFLKGLKEKYPHHCGFQARYILRLKESYHADDIHAALLHATQYYAFDAKTVERILKARATPRRLPAFRDTSRIFEALPVVKQRPLEDYHDFLKEPPYDEHRQYQSASSHPEVIPDGKGPGCGTDQRGEGEPPGGPDPRTASIH